MGGVRIALIAALSLVAVAIAVVLSGSPPAVTRSREPLSNLTELASVTSPALLCQGGEVLPAGTSAVRMSLETLIGPPVSLTASADGHLLTSGRRTAGWSSGSITIPVKPISQTHTHVTVCARIAQPREPIDVDGYTTSPAIAARDASDQPAPGRLYIEYLRPGVSSWWSRVSSVARHMGLGHAAGGTWIALLAATVMASVASLMSWLILRELR